MRSGVVGLAALLLLSAACTPQGPLVSKASPTASAPHLSTPFTSPSFAAPTSPSSEASSSRTATPPPVHVGGGWQRLSGSMSVARADFAGVLLREGRVLVAGGEISSIADTATAEVYDPATQVFTSANPMQVARNGHSATLLPNGKVLVAGGTSVPTGGAALASAELYDPATNMWSAAAHMSQPRAHHVAVLLSNGKVFVAGGDGGTGSDPTGFEVYDPTTDTWTAVASLYGPRATGPIVAVLHDGHVVIDDGLRQVVPGGVELYDPATGQDTFGHFLNPTERSYATAATLADGTVLVVGGQATYQPAGALSTTDIYDPSQDTGAAGASAWAAGPAMNVGHCHHTMTVMQNGQILVAGGRCGSSDSIGVTEVFDPGSKAWTVVGPLQDPRGYHVAVRLADGRVLVAGGFYAGGAILARTEVYTPAA